MSSYLNPDRIKVWDIPGGVHPPENKEQSLQKPLAEAALPSEVVLPLAMHMGAPAECIVNIGEQVKTGQMIAKPVGAFSAAVHASISGTIVAIEDRQVPHASGLTAPCVVVESDGKDAHIEYSGTADYSSLEPAEIIERLRNAGLAGMGGAGFPTAIKLAPKNKIHTLILNGTECEPYITSDHTIMREQADFIIKGAELLSHALGGTEKILIGVEDNKPDAIEALKLAAENTPIEVIQFETKYPSGGEKQLIQILTGLEVPSGGLPSDHGIVMQNVATAVAAWRAIVEGKPLISRITTLVGDALEDQRNLTVRIGTPVIELLNQVGYDESRADRIVMGGPMMGFALKDSQAPVTKITNCLLVPTKQEMPHPPPAQPCIRCGQCAEACPASLLPQQLFWYAQAQDHSRLKDYNLFDCIECGACAYVCPSHIPLVQNYRAAKGEIRQEELDKKHADHARERFEARKLRLEKEAEEREAKRKARMEAAKAKQAEKKSSGEDDLVAKAMARVAKAQDDPAEAREKLLRQKQTFVDRIAGMQSKLDAADTDELRAKFQSQIKNTEKKLSGIEERLQQLESTAANTSNESAKPTDKPAGDSAAAAIEKAKQQAAKIGQMSDREKLESNIESLVGRLAKSDEKIAAAEEAGDKPPEMVEALKKGRDNLAAKLDAAKAELQALGGNSEDAETAGTTKALEPEKDAATLAIERAQKQAAQQGQMSDREKIEASIDSLSARLAKSEEKITAAEEAGDKPPEMVDALKKGRDNLAAKLDAAKAELQALGGNSEDAETTGATKALEPEKDAATLAIERAQKQAAQQGQMSDREKIEASIDSLSARLAKSEEKIAAAEKAGDKPPEMIDALRKGRDNLADKLASAKTELENLAEEKA